jgi:Acyl-protein synthetase, LuxE
MVLSQGSLDRVKALAWRIHKELGMVSDEKVNYLCFTYDPHVARDLGTAFTDELLTGFTGRNEVYYALQWDEVKSDFVFNAQGVADTLHRFAKAGLPVRILGFPAFLHKVIVDFNLKLDLGPRSWVQTGGGWKNMADEEIPKQQFRQFVSDRLGLPVENIRDMFGMVEHGIPYCDCPAGNLHIPNYARVFVRSPFDLSILPEGEKGLLQFLCTYNDSYPSMSLLTTDWGRVGTCNCGLPGRTLEIMGRAGVSKHKGCAIKAAEFL